MADGFEQIIAHLRDGGYRTRDEWLQIDPRWEAVDWDRRLGVTVLGAESTETSSAGMRKVRGCCSPLRSATLGL